MNVTTSTNKKQITPAVIEAFQRLYQREFHLFPCYPIGTIINGEEEEKSPITHLCPSWKNNPIQSEDELNHYLNEGYLIGCWLSRSGLAAVDVDAGGERAIQEVSELLGAPLAIAKTYSKGYHLFYPSKGNEGLNYTWEYGCGYGQIRGPESYVIVWEPEALLKAYDEMDYADPVDLSKLPKASPPKKKGKTGGGKGADSYEWIEGNRNTLLNTLAYQINKNVYDEHDRNKQLAELKTKAISEGLGEHEVDATMRSAKEAGEVERAIIENAFDDDEWLASLGLTFDDVDNHTPADKSPTGAADLWNKVIIGAPHGSVEATRLALGCLGYKVGFNELNERVELNKGKGYYQPSKEEWQKLKTTLHDSFLVCDPVLLERSKDDPKTKHTIPLRYGYKNSSYDEVRGSLAVDNPINPLRDYFNRLETNPPEHTGISIYDFLSHALGAGETPLDQYGQAMMFLGAVARHHKPGILIRNFPILIGEAGIGKSAIIRSMLPPDLADVAWSESFTFSDNDQKMVEAIVGKSLIEIGELVGVRRVEVERIKRFMTTTQDDIRLSYRPDPSTIKRRCMFIGTGNPNLKLPADKAAIARFVLLECSHGSPVEIFMNEHRDSLWYQALQVWKEEGEAALKPPKGWEAKSAERASDYQAGNPVLEDSYEAFMRTLEKREKPHRCTFEEVRAHLPTGAFTNKEIQAFLRDNGWNPKRNNQGRFWEFSG